MDKKNKNPNVPNLRFSYKGDWSKRKLNEICLFFKGNGLSKSELSNEGFPCILYGELYTTYKNEVISDIISKTNTTLSNPFLSRNNDLIIPGSGEDPIDIAVARAIYQNDIILGGDLNILRPKSNVSAAFLSYQLNGVRRYDIAKKAQGKSIVHLHNSDLKEVLVSIPSYDEQLHIVKLLTKIDEMIETQSKIIDDLLTVKNGISNKLFKLQQIELSNHYLFEYLIEGDKTAVDTSCYKKITVKLNNQGLAFSELNREMADTRPFYVRHKGELIIGKQNYFNGSIAIVTEQFDNCICSNAIMSFKIKGIYSDFLYYQISNNNYLNSQSYKANGTGQKELSEKEFLKFKIWCPQLEVQQKIVNCFKSLDLKIENEKAILNSYFQEKSYLLNNMFI